MDRTVRLVPFIFLLVGAGAGVCWAMHYCHDDAERAHVSLAASRPPTLVGLIVGAGVGGLVRSASVRWPRIAPTAVVVSAGLLAAALMAPLGWIVGDMTTIRAGDAGMLIGAAGGALVGLAIGAMQVVQHRRADATDADHRDYRESDVGSVPDEPDRSP
jgi:hypothetical protein